MRKEDVTADIPRESERIGEGTGEAAGMGRRFGEKVVVEAQLAQPVRDPQARGTGADNQDLAIVERSFRTHNSGLPARGWAIDFGARPAAWCEPASRIIVLKNSKPEGDLIRSKLENSLQLTYGNRVFPEPPWIRRHPTRRAPFCP
jgi:hypothetical protein